MRRQRSELANFLRTQRIKKGLSQKRVAAALGYSSAQYVSNIERGVCSVPIKALRKMCILYGIKREHLIAVMLIDARARLENVLNSKSVRKVKR